MWSSRIHIGVSPSCFFSLFGARTGENVGGLSVSPELFRYVVDRCAVGEAALKLERNVGVLTGA
jgi:hypothetical protein